MCEECKTAASPKTFSTANSPLAGGQLAGCVGRMSACKRDLKAIYIDLL